MALGLTQPIIEMCTRNKGKGSRCVGLTNLPSSYADCLESLNLITGLLRPVMGLLYFTLALNSDCAITCKKVDIQTMIFGGFLPS
jgi:hypothetical protein